MFYAYVLRNERGTHYYGHTEDLDNRIKKHNQGKVRSTKAKRPWRVIHFEQFDTRAEAYRRELFFKSIEGYHYLKGIGIL